MDVLEAIESRASAVKLSAPGPTRVHLEQIIRAGARAPDHGRLRPWRFAVMEGDARLRLGDALASMFKAKQPQATDVQLEGERAKVLRAPTIVAVAAHLMPGKIPPSEQVWAVAAAVENMFLAANALGYGAMWKTGAGAFDANVKRALGFAAEDHIVAFLYLGTVLTAGTASPAAIDGLVNWLT
jgi:nitroreductase